MRIHPQARELAKWPITGPDDLTLELSTDAGQTWHPLTRDGKTATALVAGPDAQDNPPGTIVLPAGRTHCLIRAIDNPEIPYRSAGTIDVRA